MDNNNQEIIKNNLLEKLSLLLPIGKLFDLKYFYMLLVFILSLDSYLIFKFRESILSIDFISIINPGNIRYLIQYILGFSFTVAFSIPVAKFLLYKALFVIFNAIRSLTSYKIYKQKESSSDDISVDRLYREALLEQNQYKLDTVYEYYKDKKEFDKVTNIVLSAVVFIIIDLLISNNGAQSLCSQLKDQLFMMNNKIIKYSIFVFLCFFLYSTIALLKTGYDKTWNYVTTYPKNKE